MPTCTLFRFQFPINTFCTQFKKGVRSTLPFARASQCVVLRHECQLAVCDLQPASYALLTLLVAGLSVPEAKAAFCQRTLVAADTLAQLWPG